MHVDVTPAALQVPAGQAGRFTVSITNTTDVIDAYSVRMYGLDPQWISTAPESLALFPGETGAVDVAVALPSDYPATARELAVDVRGQNEPDRFGLRPIRLVVEPRGQVRVAADPVVVHGGSAARFGLIVTNAGNQTVHAVPVATDPEGLATFDFQPSVLVVPPGRSAVVHTTVSGGRSWFGPPRARVFELGVEADGRVETAATFIQRPRVGRWLLSLIGLLLAALVFALVLRESFQRVVDEASVAPGLLEQALATGASGGVRVPVNPARITGSVVSASVGDDAPRPVPGVQADLFLSGDTVSPIASAVTGANGQFAFAQLGEGDHKIRFSGAGFDSIWFGGTRTPGDAAVVTTVLGEPTTLVPFALAARPGSVRGLVTGADPVGAVVTLTVPGQLDPGTAALVGTTEASADGSFLFESVPSPAVYRLEVSKQGFATESRQVVLRAAQAVEGIEVALRAGDGVISGRISSSEGPLGGATIVATDGSSTISTVSLTDVDVGSYTIRNLPTPGRYTITISRDGFVAESRTVALDTAQAFPGLDATLVSARGAVRGTVSVGDRGPAGGVTVTLSGTDTERSTTTLSVGALGFYQFADVPIPGTYTVTFSGDGLVTQVRLVDLDARAGRIEADGVDATLVSDSAIVRGLVFGPDGAPVARAEIVLSDGTTDLTVPSSDEPAGEFEFTGVPPGAYTLTARRDGATPVVNLVNVLANQVAAVELRLGAQASVNGRVVRGVPGQAAVPVPGAIVRLWEPGRFPGTPDLAFRTVVADAQGRFSFTQLGAPLDFVLAVYASVDSVEPLVSRATNTAPGAPTDVGDVNVGAP